MARYWEGLRREPRPDRKYGCATNLWLALLALNLYILFQFGISARQLGQTFIVLGILASTRAEMLPKYRINLAASLRLLGGSLVAVAVVLILVGFWRAPGMSTTEKAALLAEILFLAGIVWMFKRYKRRRS